MEDEDEEFASQPSNGRISVTVAAAPPENTQILALPIQQPQKTPGSGGGREDCWSEEATAVLIEAWGERYMELSRGNLKQKHWQDVADIVNSREDYMKTPKTDVQCKNRIDTVKKKYKTEKAKMGSGGGPSKWRFFDKMDELIGTTVKMSSGDGGNSSSKYQRVPMGIPVGVRSGSVPLAQRSNVRMSKRPMVDSDEESEQEISGDSSDGLPPESSKRPRFERENVMMNNVSSMRYGMMGKKSDGGSGVDYKESSWGNSMRELTRAIGKFAEAYEQAEIAKLEQLVEMEKRRMKFAKEMELQRMQFFMKTQLDLLQLKNNRPLNNSSNHHGINNNPSVDNHNNSDSSN